MTRGEAIEFLEFEKQGVFKSLATKNAIDMAIASLKTDEVYQLEYENRDFVEIHKGMTNGEVIQAVFPCTEVVEGDEITGVRIDTKDIGKLIVSYTKWWNAPYQKGGE